MASLAEEHARTATGASNSVPRHVAVIMDGNGRWAVARGLPRGEGHRRGVEAVRRTVRAAIDLKIDYLTLFSFSSENWSRPREEVDFLFGLFRRYIRRDVAELNTMGVRISIIGDRGTIPSDILKLIVEAEELTHDNARLQLIFAFNYGARNEIRRAAQAMARETRDGVLDPDTIDDDVVGAHLDTAEFPDPDLVIRTSGEYRLSNFLLWQSAYAEFVFLPDCWPDFDADALRGAVAEYATRRRRYGGIGTRGTA